MPTVSLCLLTYNRASVLRRTLDSLLAQQYQDFELIINDDCSSDATPSIAQEYERRDARVRYCRNPTNLRYAGNQNAAAERATGEFIAYVHDGDVYYPNMVQLWVEALRQNPTAGIVFNALDVHEEHGITAAQHRHDYPPLIRGLTLFDEMITASSSPIFGIVMLRASTLKQLGAFDVTLPVLADVDMWLRLLLHHDAAYVSTPLFSVMPREVGHINRPPLVNWGVQAERDRIYVINLARRFGGWSRVPIDARRALLRKRLGENGSALVRCLLKGGFKEALAGLKVMTAGRPFGTTVDLAEALQAVSMNRIVH